MPLTEFNQPFTAVPRIHQLPLGRGLGVKWKTKVTLNLNLQSSILRYNIPSYFSVDETVAQNALYPTDAPDSYREMQSFAE